MVAFQKVDYDSRGEILPPLPVFMRSSEREPNGKYSSQRGCWHRHTLSASGDRDFETKKQDLLRFLQRSGAEVFKVEPHSRNVVDFYYLMEDPQQTAKAKRLAASGRPLRQRSSMELWIS